MEPCQLVNDVGAGFNIVLLQEFVEQFVALLLKFATVAAQDGLDFCLCLCGTHKVDPCRLYVLCLGCQNLHLVATFKLVAERHQLVVDLGADTM